MSPIEAAAREIETRAGTTEDVFESFVSETTEIITRHLFPLVKPEDVADNDFYWVLYNEAWTIEVGHEINWTMSDKIYGPIPMPEVKQ